MQEDREYARGSIVLPVRTRDVLERTYKSGMPKKVSSRRAWRGRGLEVGMGMHQIGLGRCGRPRPGRMVLGREPRWVFDVPLRCASRTSSIGHSITLSL